VIVRYPRRLLVKTTHVYQMFRCKRHCNRTFQKLLFYSFAVWYFKFVN